MAQLQNPDDKLSMVANSSRCYTEVEDDAMVSTDFNMLSCLHGCVCMAHRAGFFQTPFKF